MEPQYVILDKHYHPEEGQECFKGTLQECIDWKNEQCRFSKSNEFMLEIIPND